MAPTTDVLFAMTGDVHRNARALRQLGALAQAGLSVTLLALEPGELRSDLPSSVRPVHVPILATGGPRFFFEVHGRFGEAALAHPARLVHASDLYVLRALAGAARTRRARLTYDARELYTHVASVEGRPWVRRFWTAFEKGPIRRADVVFTVSDAIADRLASTYRIRRPLVQWNAPVAGPAPPDDYLRRSTGISDDTFVFVHLGQMRAGRGGEAIIRASCGIDRATVVFLGYGPGRPQLEELARSLGAPVHFLDPVEPHRIRGVLSGADAGLTLLEDSCLNHRLALPNKLFDYLAAGLPVLASPLPEISRIVSLHSVGLLADPRDERGLAETMRSMTLDPARRAEWRRSALAAAETFDWARASQAFVSHLLPLVR